jgi:hypothetical protein
MIELARLMFALSSAKRAVSTSICWLFVSDLSSEFYVYNLLPVGLIER